jgi:GUN4-like
MKWMGMTLGAAMFSGVAGLRHLVEKRRSDGRRSRSYRGQGSELSSSDVLFSTAVNLTSDLESYTTTPNQQVLAETTIDEYARLRKLLSHCQYEEADRETWQLMQRISGVHQRGYFEIRDFEDFPTLALQTIDGLWFDASKGHFGLSVQKRIYREEDRQYDRLGSRVGWVDAGKWLTNGDRLYRQEMPQGHLPLAMWRSQLASFGFFGLGMCLEVFLSREDF